MPAIPPGSTMKHIYVNRRPGCRTLGILRVGGLVMACALGRSGIASLKREGDGATPRGTWPLRRSFYRPDRIRRVSTGLPLSHLKMNDGWCDQPFDCNYNRHVSHPYPSSAERMWRSDRLYDVVVVVGHNDFPRKQGGGSAIFIHVANEGPQGLLPTEGCIALKLGDLRRLIERIGHRTKLIIE